MSATPVPQARGPAVPAPIGIVYNTSMSRPDAALALAALYVFARRNQARVGAVCVAGAGLNTAIYCDVVNRFFRPGPPGNSNGNFVIGLAAVTPLPPDPPMVAAAVNRKRETGEPQYIRSIAKLSDTAQADALLRNGVTLSVQSAVMLSAPATWLAKSLDTLGTKDQYKQRVRRLVIVDGGAPQQDVAALRKVIAEWPAPVFFVGRDVGEALVLSSAAMEKAFAWAPAHPVVDAFRSFKPAPYDLPLHDLAAMYYTAQPESGFFPASEPGSLSVSDAGELSFAAGSGSVRRVTVDPAKKMQALEALLTVAATEPPPPPTGRGRG